MPESPYNNTSQSSNGPEPPDRMNVSSSGYTQPMPTSPIDISSPTTQSDWQDGAAGYGAPANNERYSVIGSGYQAAPSYESDQVKQHPDTRSGYSDSRSSGPVHAQPENASAAVAAQQPKPSGVKTFFIAFLGALVACALAFGVYTAVFGGAKSDAASPKESASISQDESASGLALGNQSPTSVTSEDGSITLAEAVAAKATPSVVCIYVYQQAQNYSGFFGASESSQSEELTESSLGSGIVLTEDGYILTNYHVIENSDALKVSIEGTEYDAEVVGTDSSSDLAVIKATDASGLTPADIGDSDDLAVGEWVMTVGSPFGLESSVATGVVSATSRSRIVESSGYSDGYGYGYSSGYSEPTLYPNMIQTDAAINPGNSGGALVDSDGKVIGVNTLIASYSGNYSGVGFAIPINYAINIADQIIAGKTPTHAKLGVSLITVNSSVAKRYGLAAESGAYVSEVSAGSGADAAGIKSGDIIVGFNGKEVTNSTDLTLDIREQNPGDSVTVTVNRDGETLDLEVTLGSDEADQEAAAMQQQQLEDQYGQLGGQGSGSDLSYEELLELLGNL